MAETYGYDADGARVSRTRAGVTMTYLAGAWEQDVQSGASTKTRAFVTLQGRAIAQRERVVSPASDTTIYLHGDHLGGVSVATSSTGAVLSRQAFTPWGELRAGGGDVTQTTLDFTGQKKDDTGLLFYNARYFDPKLGRFVSPDSIVPGLASGKGGMAATLGPDGSVALRPLTVDFHEPGFAATIAREDVFTQAKGFRFQLANREKQRGEGSLWPWGPRNPQALNRYSYVINNPLRYTDPHGHSGFDDGADEGGGEENVAPASGAVAGGDEGGGGGGGGGGGYIYEPYYWMSADFESRAELNQHFADHYRDWDIPLESPAQYQEMARDLLDREADYTVGWNEPLYRATGRFIEYIRKNGDIVIYDRTTGEFAVGDHDGTIGTFMRPENGEEYFWQQVRNDR